jgi:class 3 adenylate cyclase
MEQYVGLDVSLKMTAICIVDRTGKIEREGMVVSDPAAIAAFVRLHAPHVARIGLETGATSTWLWTELNKMRLPDDVFGDGVNIAARLEQISLPGDP